MYTRAIKWLTITYALVYVQVLLGILTLVTIKTRIPIFYAILHQLTGILFLMSLVFLFFSLRKKNLPKA
jgi:cytochrome c oxidase assembly protein subunit 15